LGKAQRALALIDPSIGPILAHGAVRRLNDAYAAMGVALPPTLPSADSAQVRGRGLVIAPPSAANSLWLRRFGALSTALASGWMQVRGAKRWRNLDRGFVLSDHADWDGLNAAVAATGASRVLVTHGQVPTYVRWLQERGLDAAPLLTQYVDEMEAVPEDELAEAAS
ncbi:MAG TPA: DNA ligase-associated DEXH box helicase, partial [Planctomycetota bacterium]|nr:DNA ligase-associated DEXH box helicase [Planctomycetota bacterium]